MAPRDSILALQAAMNAEVLGQPVVVERMLIGLLADGHLLIEGLPGLAKTRAVKAMARHLEADFSRIQFTPDLLPSDVTGTDVYYSEAGKGQFRFQPGPVFGNILLADEINRAPAKVQAALLEAMQERQVTVGQETHALPDLFIVMATQNPIEQEGTYPLPEAQLDRFLMQIDVDYPDLEAERKILFDTTGAQEAHARQALTADDLQAAQRLVRSEEQAALAPAPAGAAAPPPKATTIGIGDVFAARREIAGLHVAEAIERYIVDLVDATRHPGKYSEDLARQIELGASPRAGLALDRCGRALAWLRGQDFVSPGDVQAVAPDVLRHRIALSYEARGAGRTPDAALADLVARVAVA